MNLVNTNGHDILSGTTVPPTTNFRCIQMLRAFGLLNFLKTKSINFTTFKLRQIEPFASTQGDSLRLLTILREYLRMLSNWPIVPIRWTPQVDTQDSRMTAMHQLILATRAENSDIRGPWGKFVWDPKQAKRIGANLSRIYNINKYK